MSRGRWGGRGEATGQKPTHVPLLNLLKVSAQVSPSKARRLATMLRTHSSTQPRGCTYFHRAGLLLPMVVSSVTWGEPKGGVKSHPAKASSGSAQGE